MPGTQEDHVAKLYARLAAMELVWAKHESARREELAPLGGVGLADWRDGASGADGLRIAALEATVEAETYARCREQLQDALALFERRTTGRITPRGSSRPS